MTPSTLTGGAARAAALRAAALRAVALAVALPLAGCAGAFSGYDLAPNGLPREDAALRQELAFEAGEAYRAVVDGERAIPDDDLLRLLYAGIAGRYASAYDESSRLLDLASYVAEDRVTLSVSREALSMITSDRALPYVPGRTERMMIPYLSALNYLESGDVQGAAVEARRIEALLDRTEEGVPPAEKAPDSRFLHYFAGTIFEAAGDANAAGVAYRRAGTLAETLTPAGAGPSTADGDSMGDVVVLVERGFIPHRVEQSVVIVVPPAQVDALTSGSGGERAGAALEAAARTLLTASVVYGDRSGYYHDRGFQSPIHLEPWRGDRCRDGHWEGTEDRCYGGEDDDGDEDSDADPYMLRISWPVLFDAPTPTTPLRVRADELGVDAAATLDLAASARRDFEAARPAILARTLARSVAKLALSAGAKEAVAEKDENAGRLVGILTNLGTLLTERADTRCWHLLPGSVSLVRLRLPAGEHELTLEQDGVTGDLARQVALGRVVVRPGGVSFLSARLWR